MPAIRNGYRTRPGGRAICLGMETCRYRYSLTLRLRHPSMETRAMTEATGISPFRSLEPGAPRLPGTSDGAYWTGQLCKGAWPPISLSDAVASSLSQLSGRRSFLDKLRSENGSAELFIGWFFEGQSGDTFDYRLLARAADLGIDLSFDVYAQQDCEQVINVAAGN